MQNKLEALFGAIILLYYNCHHITQLLFFKYGNYIIRC